MKSRTGKVNQISSMKFALCNKIIVFECIQLSVSSLSRAPFLLSFLLFFLPSFRTEDPPASRELLGVLEIDKWFSYLEIFPRRKFAHFEK